MYAEEGAQTFSLRVFDCLERLFDELPAGDFLAGKKLRKLDDGHGGEFMSSPTLCESRLCGAFETGTPVDVATGHACDLACGIEPGDRFEVLVEHGALKVGLDTAEVFARQRKDLNRVIRRRVERLR